MSKTLTSAIDVAHQAVRPGRLRAVAYLRVSTEEQKKGYGISYTEKKVLKHFEKKDWAHVGTYADEGYSGSLEWHQRPDLKRLMEDARKTPRPFDLVGVHEARAIGRRDRAFWPWVWELEDLGVYVAVVKGDYENTTSDGRSRMRKDADRAEDERETIRDRTQGGLQEKAEEGGYTGGFVPFGYRIENQGIKGESRLVLEEGDLPALNRARMRFVETKSWPRVASTLNAEGLLTRSGGLWTHQNLQKIMLGDPILNARTVFRKTVKAKLDREGKPLYGEQVTITLPPIFTEEETEELRAAAELARKGPPVRRGRVYPLSNRLICRCGGRYTGHLKNGRSPRYRCGSSCDLLDAEAVEAAVWSNFCEALGDIDRLRQVAEDWAGVTAGQGINHIERLADLEKQITALRRTVRVTASMTIRQAISEGASDKEAEGEAEAAVSPFREELVSLESLKAEVAAWQAETEQAGQRARDLMTLAEAAHRRLERLTPEQRQRLLTVLETVVTVNGPAPAPRAGAACTLAAWFRDRNRMVPALDWEAVADLFPKLRKLDTRMAVEGLLCKARTGAPWKGLPEEYGHGPSLHTHWTRWSGSGVWEQAMDRLAGQPGEPPYEAKPQAPPMSIKTLVIPELLLEAEQYLDGGSRRHGLDRVLFKFPLVLAV